MPHCGLIFVFHAFVSWRRYILYSLQLEWAICFLEMVQTLLMWLVGLCRVRWSSQNGFLRDLTPEGNLTLEKLAVWDWLSSTSEIKKNYDIQCFIFMGLCFFFFWVYFSEKVFFFCPPPFIVVCEILLRKVCLIYFCVGCYQDDFL